MNYPIIHTMEQGSEEWHAVKLGLISASNFKTAIGKPGATRTKLMYKLIGERGYPEGVTTESYSNDAMLRGIELEAEARAKYEPLGHVTEIGFYQLNDDIGVSPDGLVGDDGAIEIKCPNTATHCQYIDENRMQPVYVQQVQGILWVTGRKWCDFISYDPRYASIPFWHIRVDRDEKIIAEIEVKVNAFVDEMKKKIVNMDKMQAPKF